MHIPYMLLCLRLFNPEYKFSKKAYTRTDFQHHTSVQVDIIPGTIPKTQRQFRRMKCSLRHWDQCIPNKAYDISNSHSSPFHSKNLAYKFVIRNGNLMLQACPFHSLSNCYYPIQSKSGILHHIISKKNYHLGMCLLGISRNSFLHRLRTHPCIGRIHRPKFQHISNNDQGIPHKLPLSIYGPLGTLVNIRYSLCINGIPECKMNRFTHHRSFSKAGYNCCMNLHLYTCHQGNSQHTDLRLVMVGHSSCYIRCSSLVFASRLRKLLSQYIVDTCYWYRNTCHLDKW